MALFYRCRTVFFSIVIICTAAPFSFTQDFGALINQKSVMTSVDDIEYSASVIPWFAAPLGEKTDLYLSGGLTAEYDSEKWSFLPDVYRFGAAFNPSPNFRLETGRVQFQESLGWVASGLFDGMSAAVNIKGGRLKAGVFYTGLLYKKNANIFISQQDSINYLDDDIYFASRRLVSGVTWEETSIFDSNINFSASGLLQFDFNDADSRVHSQYLTARLTVPFGSRINTEWGAVFEMLEETGKDPCTAFAVSAEIQWLHQGALPGLLTLGGRFASGAWSDSAGTFVPVTSEAQGKVLRPMLSGIALAQAVYTVRPARSFFTELSAAFFFRTDSVTFAAAGMDGESSSSLLGGEVYLNLFWQPFTDLLFSLGGGAFFPQLGKVFAGNAGIKYRLELTAGISL